MMKWTLVSSVAVLILVVPWMVVAWRVRWPRWFWNFTFQDRVNTLVAAVTIVSLPVSVLSMAVGIGALLIAKQTLERESRQPAVLVMTLIEAPLSPGGVQARELMPFSTLSTGHSMSAQETLIGKNFFVRNVGNDWLRKTRVAAHVVSPEDRGAARARLECITFPTLAAVSGQHPCDIADLTPPDLPPDPDRTVQVKITDLWATVYFTVPKGAKNVYLLFTVSGENLEGGNTYSVTTDLP